MIGILVGFAVAGLIIALVFALCRANWHIERMDELYRIACDEARHWHDRYDVLVAQTADERIKAQNIMSLKAKADYYADKEREARTFALHELDRAEGHG